MINRQHTPAQTTRVQLYEAMKIFNINPSHFNVIPERTQMWSHIKKLSQKNWDWKIRNVNQSSSSDLIALGDFTLLTLSSSSPLAHGNGKTHIRFDWVFCGRWKDYFSSFTEISKHQKKTPKRLGKLGWPQCRVPSRTLIKSLSCM